MLCTHLAQTQVGTINCHHYSGSKNNFTLPVVTYPPPSPGEVVKGWLVVISLDNDRERH